MSSQAVPSCKDVERWYSLKLYMCACKCWKWQRTNDSFLIIPLSHLKTVTPHTHTHTLSYCSNTDTYDAEWQDHQEDEMISVPFISSTSFIPPWYISSFSHVSLFWCCCQCEKQSQHVHDIEIKTPSYVQEGPTMYFMFPLIFIRFLPNEPNLCPVYELNSHVEGPASGSTDQVSTREGVDLTDFSHMHALILWACSDSAHT